jgi:hypothetical protein
VGGAAGGYAGLQWLGRAYGSTGEERARALPGDGLCPAPLAVTTHATTIEAPPEAVWPWLVQMGWHRGGWYTAPWVDRLLFPDNWAAAERILPELQQLKVGDEIPDGAPETECVLVVDQLEPNRHLVLHSRKHLPPGWERRFGAWPPPDARGRSAGARRVDGRGIDNAVDVGDPVGPDGRDGVAGHDDADEIERIGGVDRHPFAGSRRLA